MSLCARPMSGIVLLAAGAAVSWGCAPPPAQSPSAIGRSCFDSGLVEGFESDKDASVKLHLRGGDIYRIDLVGGNCRDVGWSTAIAFETRSGRTVCTGSQAGDIKVSFRDPTSSRAVHCDVAGVTRLPAEARGGDKP